MFILRLAFCGLVLLAVASPRGIAATGSNASTIHFKWRAESLIVLPVKVNGAGPFEFLLDTGASVTAVDAALADQLKLPMTGTVVTATLGSSSVLQRVHSNKLEVAGAAVRDLDLVVMPTNGILSQYRGARGVLGENFLRNFDLLIDNHHRLLHLEAGPGPMGETLAGQHVPVHSHGSFEAGSTENRLILAVNVPELRAEPLSCQLDSGAGALILFRSAYRGPSRLPGVDVTVARHADGSPADGHRLGALSVGDMLLGNVLALSSAQSQVADVDGLLPTSLFKSVFISHSGGYAIFNPVAKVAIGR